MMPKDSLTLIKNPSQTKLRELALKETPFVFKTERGNLNKISHNKSRVAQWTYVAAKPEEKNLYSGVTLPHPQVRELIGIQKKYIESKKRLIVIEGYLGSGPRAVAVEWLYTPEGANIAGMQQILSFSREAVESADQLKKPFRPEFQVVYTPGLKIEGMPGQQAIVVDLEKKTTHIMGPDYFGESKKAALRLLNDHIYQRGGLVLHAGAKIVKIGGKAITMTIMGLSGTGKTTTTFSKQGDLTQPIQDDMVSLWPGGECGITENGCFAKTYGLTHETEPVIFEGTRNPEAWVENVFTDAEGKFDFSKGFLTPDEVAQMKSVLKATAGATESNLNDYISGRVKPNEIVDENGLPREGWDFALWTQNGRSVIPMGLIPDAADFSKIPPVGSMGILNRDEGRLAAMPGILRFSSPEQAAGYFMLGETTKTSAAGKERGKTRSPFTQPFFPRAHGLQAKRFWEIAATMPNTGMWLMNTGYVGGAQKDVDQGTALKVKIRHSSAMLEAMLQQEIHWKKDPDFGYEIVDVDHPANAKLLSLVPKEILNPVLLFKLQNREADYKQWVQQMNEERKTFLEKYDVDPAVIKAVVRNGRSKRAAA
ncbi:MAG: phosphoenolpyruvate carboxykinase (ATP) [Deltaproteobacteria bacterium]|nr:phosphoenolpyruvate carboxykinase (ATP) [Deltaproteobacteria bacterium]